MIDVPYLTEGAHLLSFRYKEGRDTSLRTVHLWRPEFPESSVIRATSCLALGVYCRRRASRATIRIDGQSWDWSRWLCAQSPEGWRGMAWLDLERISPGPHRITVRPRGHRAVDYNVVTF
jgi:hypothetical protein